MKTATAILAGILIFVGGWVSGVTMTMNGWERSAKRGVFEVGGVVYKVTVVKVEP